MNASELRIGNLVTDNFYETFKSSIEVESIGEKGINLSASDDGKPYGLHRGTIEHEYDFEKINGIPLTTEWLERMGFVIEEDNLLRTHKLYVNRFISLHHENQNFSVAIQGVLGTLPLPNKIASVHQLQNLWHSLTGKELEIKP